MTTPKTTPNAPREAGEITPKWFSATMACGTTRHQLYINGERSPWFVDVASVRAHFTDGHPVAVWGAGMSEPNSMGQRIAACFGTFTRVTAAKARAEELATALAGAL